jgi:hypothetical protein
VFGNRVLRRIFSLKRDETNAFTALLGRKSIQKNTTKIDWACYYRDNTVEFYLGGARFKSLSPHRDGVLHSTCCSSVLADKCRE